MHRSAMNTTWVVLTVRALGPFMDTLGAAHVPMPFPATKKCPPGLPSNLLTVCWAGSVKKMSKLFNGLTATALGGLVPTGVTCHTRSVLLFTARTAPLYPSVKYSMVPSAEAAKPPTLFTSAIKRVIPSPNPPPFPVPKYVVAQPCAK